jgi:cell division protein FtsB
MATRAHAGRVAAGPRRRPAARKRRPAARQGASRVNWDRVGRVALTLVLAAVLYSYLNPAIDFVKTYTATTAAKAQLHQFHQENRRLHERIQSAGDPIVVNREARAQGMVAEGETPIVVRGLGR